MKDLEPVAPRGLPGPSGLQCKDIPDRPILEWLVQRKRDGKGWAFWYAPEDCHHHDSSICHAMPPNTPEKIRIRKMDALIRRGLVSGCGCGCRGDYEITDKGIQYLEKVNEQSTD